MGGQVGHMRASEERHDVMLAMRVELDVAQHDDIVIAADVFERGGQCLERAFFVSLEELAIGIGDASRRVAEPLACGIIASPGNERADCRLHLCLRRALDRRTRRRGGYVAMNLLDDGIHGWALASLLSLY